MGRAISTIPTLFFVFGSKRYFNIIEFAIGGCGRYEFFMRLISTSVLGAVSIWSMIFFTSCPPGCLTTTNEVLPAYHQIKLQKDECKIEKGKYAIYYDLSDGMKFAYQDNTLKDYLSDITNRINGSWNVYGLVTGQVEPISERGSELYAKVNREPYTDIKAPIEESMKDVIRKRMPSLIVSDLEEYQTINGKTEIQHRSAYAKNYFSQWLKMGGQIYFFVMDYKEPVNQKSKTSAMKDKHLFFVAFDNAEGEVRNFVEKAIEIRPKSYRTFNLSNKTYSLSTSYANATQGGNYHDSNGMDIISAVNEKIGEEDYFINDFENNWEFYPCFVSWNDMLKNAKDMQNPEVPKTDQYEHFLSKLFITFEDEDAFKIDNLDITVTNIQEDFEKYKNYATAMKCLDEKNENGSVSPEYKSVQGTKVLDMFKVSMNETKEKGKYEICVDFSDNFNGQNAKVNEGDMLKLDITIGNVQKGNIQNMEDNFVWNDVDDKNEAIFQSVLNTLDDTNISPKGKLVYTYYVRAY